MNNNEIKKVLGMFLTMQSMIHQIDEISDSVLFKQEFKRETNRYYKYIEIKVNQLTREMDLKEAQYYIDIVAKIDKVIQDIELKTI
tara:strand:- start:930 stop:1187 length:258 start_codon:yes stop_codon:yes gene_type:complete